jgi:lipase
VRLECRADGQRRGHAAARQVGEEETVPYEAFDVEVPGGTIRVGRWGHGPHAVIAAHGLTATHLSFQALADQLGDDVTLLAPDLRGRGRSTAGQPYGMAAHADDLIAVLDHAGVGQALVAGHSMGGFAAVVAADRHPERVTDLVLIDGGMPLDLSALAGLDLEQVVRAITGPALDRLRMTFASPEAYLDYWRAHPALTADWNDYIERCYRYDLAGEAPELASTVREEAVLEDSASELRSGDVERALRRLTLPVLLIRAPLGMLGTEPPLYPDPVVDAARNRVPQLTDVLVPGVNHYTILLTEHGASAVADVIRGRLAA